MEPQIINYYNHKNVLCKICGRKGHTSECCPNVGMAKIGKESKGSKESNGSKRVDLEEFMLTIPQSSPPKKKRGRKPKKEGKTYEFKDARDARDARDAIGNSSNRDSYLPEKGWSDTAWNEYVKTIRNLEPEGLPPIPKKLFQ